jgi:hypothetical protein
VSDHVEPIVVQKPTIFVAVQACVEERLALLASYPLAGRWTAGEHQRRTRRGMALEDREHPALIVLS